MTSVSLHVGWILPHGLSPAGWGYQAIGYSWTHKSQFSSLERNIVYFLGSNLKSQGRALMGASIDSWPLLDPGPTKIK